MKTLENSILKECACGPEELHVLLSLIDFDDSEEVVRLATAMSSLVREGCISAQFGAVDRAEIDANELVSFVNRRRARNESLEDYPVDGVDYTFYTTKFGLEALSEKDRPIEK